MTRQPEEGDFLIICGVNGMSSIEVPRPVKLIMSMIFSSEDLVPSVGRDIVALFGQIDFVSERFPFCHSKYYEEEMGKNLERIFIAFGFTFPRNVLPTVKIKTNTVERKYSDPLGRRRVNLDPGILTLHNFILATGKDFSHRIYLGEGIYGDLTLLYQAKTFVPLQWTYPDYSSQEVIHIFNGLRKRYLYQLRRSDRTGEGHIAYGDGYA
jgi:hypothetical protein